MTESLAAVLGVDRLGAISPNRPTVSEVGNPNVGSRPAMRQSGIAVTGATFTVFRGQASAYIVATPVGIAVNVPGAVSAQARIDSESRLVVRHSFERFDEWFARVSVIAAPILVLLGAVSMAIGFAKVPGEVVRRVFLGF